MKSNYDPNNKKKTQKKSTFPRDLYIPAKEQHKKKELEERKKSPKTKKKKHSHRTL
jgi:hypothetical protein